MTIFDGAFIDVCDEHLLAHTPVVSVHMLAYRHGRFLAQAIEGVLAQECQVPYELIIAEDCSPDDTLEVALSFQKSHPSVIRVIHGRHNVGMHENSRRSLQFCRGEYFAFCEGDDYWHHPGKLQFQVDAMRAGHDITLCHTDFDRLIGNRLSKGCHARAASPYLAHGHAYAQLLHHWTVMTATSMYRADVIHAFMASKFSDKSWPFGDYNLALFASQLGRVAYLPISTAVWRKVVGSATNNEPKRILDMRLASLACREAFLAEYPVSDEARRDCLCFANRNVMNAAFHACDEQAFNAARNRLLALGGKLPRFHDWLRRIAVRWRFPARAYQRFRSTILHATADAL